MLEELKKKFDAMEIVSLEKMVEDCHKHSRESQKEMIEVLIYLKTSKRYKENKRYAKESFLTYIEDRFNMRPQTYRENERAYTHFPDQFVEYGIGLVRKVMEKCGERKTKEVFKEIEKGDETKHLNRAQIEKIIEKHIDPKRIITKEHKDWKAMYEREAAAHESTRASLKESMEKINELEEQIVKLKKTASVVVGIRKYMKEHDQQIAAS